jgi:hypothetical protein
MKILYMAHIREGTGWSRAAISGIRSLIAAGFDVVYRDVALTNSNAKLPEDIVEYEKKNLDNVTTCIQHVLPYYYVKTGKIKTIGYLEYEADTFNTGWKEYIKLVDEIWAPNQGLVNKLKLLGLKSVCVPHASDIEQYSNISENISIPELDYTYKFYTLSDLNDRKNIRSLVRSFHMAFDKDYPVSLIIKAKKNSMSEMDLKNYVEEICGVEKTLLRLYKDISCYKKEFILIGDMPSSQIMSLHKYGDCFVNSSSGEAWSYPTFDAMAVGNSIISTEAGTADYLTNYDNSMFVNTHSSPCLNTDSAFSDLYTGRDSWNVVDCESLAHAMFHVYSNQKKKDSKGLELAKKYSYESIGQQIKDRGLIV